MLRGLAVSRRLVPLLVLVPGILAFQIAAQRIGHHDSPGDWPQFGVDAASSGASVAPTGITPANIGSMTLLQVPLDGTVDSSAIYLRGVDVNGSTHDTFFVTTSYGKTMAIDAARGAILWEYTPAGFAGWAGSPQITTSSPAADPDRQNIYAAAPDGSVQKLAIEDGHLVWTTKITMLPSHEKISSPLKHFGGRIFATTGGYTGDAPPYQGHLVILDAQTGAIQHVWNSLCSDRPGVMDPASCGSTRAAIWGRGGAVIDSATGNIFVATGNGPYDGQTDWGDSIIELDPDATHVIGNYSPATNSELDGDDLDLGSTSPVLLGNGILAQGGKDSLIRLLSIQNLAGADPHVGNELQSVATPSGAMLFTAPAVWRDRGGTWLFAADAGASTGWQISNGQMTQIWSHPTGGTSPVIAGRLLYIYNPTGGLHVYIPKTGTEVANLACGAGHFNTPIVADRRIALPEGNANNHGTTGVLDIWSLPAPH